MAPFDSCHIRVIRNQQNLYPIFLLLQYSGLGSNTGMGFLRTNDLSEVKNGELNLDFDSCHGRVSGIKKICIRSSSYCRSQATAA